MREGALRARSLFLCTFSKINESDLLPNILLVISFSRYPIRIKMNYWIELIPPTINLIKIAIIKRDTLSLLP